MTIIEFYKNLSVILTDTRENFLSQNQAKKKLNNLLESAKDSGLKVDISENILDPITLMRLDDENSYREDGEDDYGYDSSYGYGSSY